MIVSCTRNQTLTSRMPMVRDSTKSPFVVVKTEQYGPSIMEYAVHVELSIIDGQRYHTNPGKLTTVCVMKVPCHILAILYTLRGRACKQLL